jgi:hypothetical protein
MDLSKFIDHEGYYPIVNGDETPFDVYIECKDFSS